MTVAVCRGVMAVSVAVAGTAQAAISDTLHPFASLGYSYDDNLLRLPDGVDGPLGRSDSIKQLQAGLLLERPIGNQVITAQAKVSRVSFSNYGQLDYNGKDFSAEWQWYLLKDLTGHIGGSYAQTLAPFTDFHSSERNLRTSRREYADANWRFLSSWQVHAAFNRNEYNYDLSSQRFNDRIIDTADAGLDYLASSGSRIGVQLRRSTGDYTYKPVFAGVVIDSGYRQNEINANIYWYLSGVTQVQVLAGWAKREHDFFAERNTSGANGRVSAYWKPTGHLQFRLEGWREFTAVESNLVNNSLNRGASVNGTWTTSAKLKLDAQFRRETRNFNKLSTIVLPGDASDSGHLVSLGATYAPTQNIQLNLSGTREVRTGSAYIGTGSYKSNGISLNATGQF